MAPSSRLAVGVMGRIRVRLRLRLRLRDPDSKPEITVFKVRPHEKLAALLLLLNQVVDCAEQQTVIFASTRHHVELLHEVLVKT